MAQNAVEYQNIRIENVDNLLWTYYDCNDVWVYLNHSQIRQYGRYHKIEVYIENHSDTAITIFQTRDFRAMSSRNDTSDLAETQVLSYRQSRRKATCHQIANGVGLGVAAMIELFMSDKDTEGKILDFLDCDPLIEQMVDYPENCIHNRRIMKNEYMRDVTILPGEVYSGFFLIEKFIGRHNLYLTLNIGDTQYRFAWRGHLREEGEVIGWRNME